MSVILPAIATNPGPLLLLPWHLFVLKPFWLSPRHAPSPDQEFPYGTFPRYHALVSSKVLSPFPSNPPSLHTSTPHQPLPSPAAPPFFFLIPPAQVAELVWLLQSPAPSGSPLYASCHDMQQEGIKIQRHISVAYLFCA